MCQFNSEHQVFVIWLQGMSPVWFNLPFSLLQQNVQTSPESVALYYNLFVNETHAKLMIENFQLFRKDLKICFTRKNLYIHFQLGYTSLQVWRCALNTFCLSSYCSLKNLEQIEMPRVAFINLRYFQRRQFAKICIFSFSFVLQAIL